MQKRTALRQAHEFLMASPTSAHAYVCYWNIGKAYECTYPRAGAYADTETYTAYSLTSVSYHVLTYTHTYRGFKQTQTQGSYVLVPGPKTWGIPATLVCKILMTFCGRLGPTERLHLKDQMNHKIGPVSHIVATVITRTRISVVLSSWGNEMSVDMVVARNLHQGSSYCPRGPLKRSHLSWHRTNETKIHVSTHV